jgi:hypothetical protein
VTWQVDFENKGDKIWNEVRKLRKRWEGSMYAKESLRGWAHSLCVCWKGAWKELKIKIFQKFGNTRNSVPRKVNLILCGFNRRYVYKQLLFIGIIFHIWIVSYYRIFIFTFPTNGDWMVTTIMEWWTKVHNNESNLHLLVQHETYLKGWDGTDVTTFFLPHNCFLKH